MRIKKLLVIIIGLTVLSACSIQFYRGAVNEACHERVATTRNRNVCKHLKDSVITFDFSASLNVCHIAVKSALFLANENNNHPVSRDNLKQ